MDERPRQRDIFKFHPNKISKITPRGTKCPKARSGHRIVVNESNVYSFGGFNPQVEDEDDSPLFKELWKLNLVSKSWVKLKTKGFMPEELASHAAVLIEDKLLVFGGTGVPFGAASSNRVHMCDLKSLKWSQIETTGKKPYEQYGQAMTIFNNCLYVVGGTTGFEYSIDVHQLDLTTKVWEELVPLTNEKPAERYRHEIVIEDGKIYILGGGTALLSFGFKKVPVFDISTRQWKKVKTYPDLVVQQGFPLPRRCHGCVKNGPYVYICGGHDGATVFPDMWKLNLHTMQWTKMYQSLPKPVYFHSTALSEDGQMYVFGGVTSVKENKRTSNLYSVWLKIPPLREIAWQAFQHYVPKISEIPKQELLELGVPVSLVNRTEFETSIPAKYQNQQVAMP